MRAKILLAAGTALLAATTALAAPAATAKVLVHNPNAVVNNRRAPDHHQRGEGPVGQRFAGHPDVARVPADDPGTMRLDPGRERNVGSVYRTEGTGANPWSILPADFPAAYPSTT